MERTKMNATMIALITALFVLLVAVIGFGFTGSAIANADSEVAEGDYAGGLEAPTVEGTEVIKIVNSNDDVTFYDTFDEAIVKLQDGDTLTLLRDITIGNDSPGTSYESPITKNFTFDLNGNKVLSGSDMTLYLDGKTTIKDSSEESIGTVESITIRLRCNSTPENDEKFCNFIQGGNFNDYVTVDSNTLVTGGTFNNGFSTAVDGINIEIAGGTYNAGSSSAGLNISSKSVTISGGKFNDKCLLSFSDTDIYVTGGEFKHFDLGNFSDFSDIKMQISGGTFEKFDSRGLTYADCLVKGYVYQNADTDDYIPTSSMDSETKVKVVACTSHDIVDGVCTRCKADCPHASATKKDSGLVCDVCGKEIVATITRGESTYYFSSLEDAIKAVQSNETVTLTGIINYSKLNSTSAGSLSACTPVHVTKSCTLEYATGCYLKINSDVTSLIIDAGVSFTFKSGLDLSSTQNRVKIENYGIFNVVGIIYENIFNYGNIYGEGEYWGAVTNYAVKDNNSLGINGGTYKGTFINYGTVAGGKFYNNVTYYNRVGGEITNGEFYFNLNNKGRISGGTFKLVTEGEKTIHHASVTNDEGGIISGGVFEGYVENKKGATITGGMFTDGETLKNYGTIGVENGTEGPVVERKVTNSGTIYYATIKTLNNKSGGIVLGGKYNGETTINNGTIGSADGTDNLSFGVGIENNGTILSGSFASATNNADGTISGGTFSGEVTNYGTISGGAFEGTVSNVCKISGGTFNGEVNNQSETVSSTTYYGEISNGTFNGTVNNSAVVKGGSFAKLIIDPTADNEGCSISGGTYARIEVYSSSDTVLPPSGGGGATLPSTGGGATLPSTGGTDDICLGKYLADGYAFYNTSDDSLYKGGYVGWGISDVYVASHNHDFENCACACGYVCNHEGRWDTYMHPGVCTVCGYECKHTDWDTDNKCTTCGETVFAKIVDAEGNTTYYISPSVALLALKDGDTMTVITTFGIYTNYEIDKSVTIDLNGCNISSGEYYLHFCNDDATTVKTLVIKNSSSNESGISAVFKTTGFETTVKGNVSFTNTAEIKGDLTVDGTVTFRAQLSVVGDVDVSGTAIFKQKVIVEGNVKLVETVSFENDVEITGDFTANGDVSFDENVTIDGNVSVGGKATFEESLYIKGDHTALFNGESVIVEDDGKLILLNTTTTITTTSFSIRCIELGNNNNFEPGSIACSLTMNTVDTAKLQIMYIYEDVASVNLSNCQIELMLFIYDKNMTYSDLLAEGQAYYSLYSSSFITLAAMNSSYGNVKVTTCTDHTYENGVCKYCGNVCKHTELDSDNKCTTCGLTAVAQITDTTGTNNYASFDGALSALKNGDTLALLQDVTLSDEKRITKSVTIDLNGHTLSGNGSLYFLDNANCEVILKNSDGGAGGKFDVTIESWNVKLTIQNGVYGKDIYADCELTISSGSFSGTIHVQSNKTCTISSGIYSTIELQNSAAVINSGVIDTLVVGGESRQIGVTVKAVVTNMIVKATAYSVKLDGGCYDSIDLSASSLSYADLLAEGYAFTDESGLIPLANITSTTKLYVNVHLDIDHSWTDGVCIYCSKVCAHPSWTDEYKCTVCGEDCKHEHWTNGVCDACSKVCSHEGGTATCTKQATCTICGELYGNLDENNHAGEATWNVKNATEHAKEWNCCHKPIVSQEAHEWNDNGVCTECDYHCLHAWTAGICDICGKVCSHEGGKATCTTQATCTICGKLYGDFNLDEHRLVLQQSVAATTTERGRIAFYLCEDCGKCFTDMLGTTEIALEDTFTPMLPPSIVEGAEGEYVRESGSGLVFKSNADGKDFIGVSVDGIVIGEENYDKLDGGLIIGLKTEYLDTLSTGNHTLTITSAGGEATTTFTVEATPEEGLSGGAWAGIGIAIAAAVIGAMFGIMFLFKKRG